jgi:acyl carrier protein
MAALLMNTNEAIKRDIKQMMVENLMLQVTIDEISDQQPLFGPGSLGFDSVDALQMIVALDKKYGLKIPDPETSLKVLQSVSTIAETVARHLASAPAECRSSSEQPHQEIWSRPFTNPSQESTDSVLKASTDSLGTSSRRQEGRSA